MRSSLVVPIKISKNKDKEVFGYFTAGFIYYVQSYSYKYYVDTESHKRGYRYCYA